MRFSRLAALPVVTLALTLAATLPGCWPDPSDKPPVLVGTGMDMFGPVELRVHPLTRVTTDNAADGKPLVEIRLEFKDQMGDTTKGVGALAFTLRQAGALTSTVLDRWEERIDTPRENKAHWDAITRTYLFRRPLPPGADAGKLVLTATLTTPGGQTLANEMRLKGDEK
jgi:hypothetical protein